jgi:C4-dicarboxylate transporter, DctM subunit
MKLNDLVQTLYDSVIVLGIIFIIIAMATVFNYFLVMQDVPNMLLDSLQQYITSPLMFLVVTIIILLVAGLFMDSISAILIIAPLLLPTAMLFDIDLIHWGIVFIVALEIGYLTPPVGINLFVSAGVFDKPFGKVVAASLPYMLLLFVSLLLIAFIPDIALFLTK